MDHSFTCNYTSLYLISIHQMVLSRHLIAAYYSFINPERMKDLLTYSDSI